MSVFLNPGNYYPFRVADGCIAGAGFGLKRVSAWVPVWLVWDTVGFEYPWLLQMRLKGVIISVCWTFKKEKTEKREVLYGERARWNVWNVRNVCVSEWCLNVFIRAIEWRRAAVLCRSHSRANPSHPSIHASISGQWSRRRSLF